MSNIPSQKSHCPTIKPRKCTTERDVPRKRGATKRKRGVKPANGDLQQAWWVTVSARRRDPSLKQIKCTHLHNDATDGLAVSGHVEEHLRETHFFA